MNKINGFVGLTLDGNSLKMETRWFTWKLIVQHTYKTGDHENITSVCTCKRISSVLSNWSVLLHSTGLMELKRKCEVVVVVFSLLASHLMLFLLGSWWFRLLKVILYAPAKLEPHYGCNKKNFAYFS